MEGCLTPPGDSHCLIPHHTSWGLSAWLTAGFPTLSSGLKWNSAREHSCGTRWCFKARRLSGELSSSFPFHVSGVKSAIKGAPWPLGMGYPLQRSPGGDASGLPTAAASRPGQARPAPPGAVFSAAPRQALASGPGERAEAHPAGSGGGPPSLHLCKPKC